MKTDFLINILNEVLNFIVVLFPNAQAWANKIMEDPFIAAMIILFGMIGTGTGLLILLLKLIGGIIKYIFG